MSDKKIVSNVKLFPSKRTGKSKVLAFGNFTIADKIQISCSVISGKEGPFVSLPQHAGKDRDGNTKYFSDVWVKDKEWYQAINDAVISAWKDLKENGDSGSSGDDDSIPW